MFLCVLISPISEIGKTRTLRPVFLGRLQNLSEFQKNEFPPKIAKGSLKSSLSRAFAVTGDPLGVTNPRLPLVCRRKPAIPHG